MENHRISGRAVGTQVYTFTGLDSTSLVPNGREEEGNQYVASHCGELYTMLIV